MLPQLGGTSRRIAALHRLRLVCHLFLWLFCAVLLSVSAVVLAFSIKAYRGSFLHATPELLTAGSLGLVVTTLAWLPRGRGRLGFKWTASVLGEVVWTGFLALCFFGGVTSLHESTPGLLFHCGGFFICTLYIVTMLFAWLAWLSAALLCVLLLSSAIYQHTRRHRGRGVWFGPVAEWEWYFPDESRPSVSARRATFAGALEAGLQTGAPAHDPKLGTISPLPPNPSDHTADDPFRRPTADFEKDDTKEDFSPSTHTATAA